MSKLKYKLEELAQYDYENGVDNLLNHPAIKAERERFDPNKAWKYHQEHVELCWKHMSQEEKDFIEKSINIHKD